MDQFVLCVACFTVFVNCLVKQFAICLGVVVMKLLSTHPSKRFLDGFPDPSQFATAKLTH